MDVLARFPRVWCPTCNKTQSMIFDVMKANDKNDHDAADIVCDECKSIIATLHGPSAHRAGVRADRAEKAREMAGQEIDRLSDSSATEEERQRRKRGSSRGPMSSEMFAATVPTSSGPLISAVRATERAHAEALFKKDERMREGEKAMAEYKAVQQAIREKTVRLRALRLARDAAKQSRH